MRRPQVTSWIRQFATKDQSSAQRLADMLYVVSADEFSRELQRLVVQTVDTLPGTSALLPIRPLRKGASYYTPLRSRDGRGVVISPSKLPGSEGVVARIATGLVRSSNGALIAGHSLPKLRARKCRYILLLDDIIGSGQRATQFLAALYRSPTFKSWVSFGYIQPMVLAYAATDEGLDLLKRDWPDVSVRVVRRCPTLHSSGLTAEAREILVDLCSRYATRAGKPSMALGYGNVFSLLVFAHGCPNNVPSVVWHRSRRWRPLFPGRGVPAETVNELLPQNPAVALRDALTRLDEQTLAETVPTSRLSERAKRALLVLSAISRHQRRPEAISEATGLSIPRCTDMLADLRAWGLITKRTHLTQAGANELRAARRARATKNEPDIRDAFYYPRTLR